jgi:hypothetical protein
VNSHKSTPRGLDSMSFLRDTCSPSLTMLRNSTPAAATTAGRALKLARANVANRPTRRAVKQAHAIAEKAEKAAAVMGH